MVLIPTLKLKVKLEGLFTICFLARLIFRSRLLEGALFHCRRKCAPPKFMLEICCGSPDDVFTR